MPPISFNQVPNNFRVPFFSTEFSANITKPASEQETILLIGQMLTGTATPNQPVQVTDPSSLVGLFGAGSMMAAMAAAALKTNNTLPIWCLPVQDNGAGAAAAGSFTMTGPATGAGTINLYVGGLLYQAAVASADTAAAMATAIQVVLAADTNCPVTAAVDGTTTSKVNLTFKHKGLTGNYLDIRFNYQPDEEFPAGVGATIVAMASGTSNPVLTGAITGMGDHQFTQVGCPYTDATSLAALEAEFEDRWGATRQIDGHIFCAAVGSFGTLASLGNGRNSKQDTIVDIQNSPTPVWVWAACVAVVAAASAQQDPAMPLQTLPLTQVLAPARADRRQITDRNLLLFDGISSIKVDSGGNVMIERMITTYKTNGAGQPDTSYLSVEKLATLSLLRFEYNAFMGTKYARYKLGDDATKYGPGQLIVTPKLYKSEILHLFDDWAARGLVRDPAAFAAGLIVEKNDTNPDRLDALVDPTLMDQLIFVGSQVLFSQ